MKNSIFDIRFDESGYVSGLFIVKDKHQMNWCIENGLWGRAYHSLGDICEGVKNLPLEFVSFKENDNSAESVYADKLISLTVKRSFNKNGNFTESYFIKNISKQVICINRDNFGIELTSSDCYTYAAECFINRCHTHIWCGGTSSYINMLKMGESEHNLGLVLTKGALSCYSQANIRSENFTFADGTSKYVNFRGSFILNPEGMLLNPLEEYTLCFEYFVHGGEMDFYNKLAHYPSYIGINAEHFTVFDKEKISFDILCDELPSVSVDGTELDVTVTDNGYKVNYTPNRTGEHIFNIRTLCGHTHADFLVRPGFAEILRKRIRFIVENQQCKKEGALDGAYLLYDNSSDTIYYDQLNPDRNACRERLNMSILIASYLQREFDNEIFKSLERFIRFAFREFYEESTGEVFNTIGKSSEFLRLYNAPGVMLLFSEMYLLTKEDTYLDNILKLAENYYNIGGHRCYANGLCISKLNKAFALSGRKEDFERLKALVGKTVDNIIANGLEYPPHEVNFEQTIVTPAVTHISEMGAICEDKELYIREARRHIKVLERFIGHQPSHHLYEMSIRFWDGFWFGKRECYGDTFPHHLSCLSARSMLAYARLTGEKEYISRAEECLRNVSSLVFDNGRGSAAHLYPHIVNGKPGDYYDEWANDQDLVLYDALNASDLIPLFSID